MSGQPRMRMSSTAEGCLLAFSALYLYTFEGESCYARLGWRYVEHTNYFGRPVTIMSHPLI
jgi:hypothetical protein